MRAAAAGLVLLGLLGVGTYAAQRSHEIPREEAFAAETPSWRLETEWTRLEDSPDPTARSPDIVDAETSVPADETVSAEELSIASRSPCPSEPRNVVNVRDFGARGDGLRDDTSSIQKANNAVAAGGGRVVFPSGVYRAYGVKQDSCVEFRGERGATLLHPDGKTPGHVVDGRVVTTTGSIGRRSRVLTVRKTTGLRAGALVAIQGAGGRSRVQRTTLSMDAPPYVTAISVRNTKGLKTGWRNYLFLENEVISYDGISGNSLQRVQRGLFGTVQAHHAAGSVVAQAQRKYAVVVRVSGKRVTLDSRSPFRMQDVEVNVGSVGMSVSNLTVDGNRRESGSVAANPFPLKYELARWVSVRDSTIRNGDHGGVSFDMGTRDSLIEGNNLIDNGDRKNKLGAAIWLYRGATRNIVRKNTIGGSSTLVGIILDDRTIESTEYDADPSHNTIEANTIKIPYLPMVRNAGIVISGSSSNLVHGNLIANARTGILVAKGSQGPALSLAFFNRVRDNTFVSHKVGIVVSGSDNEFARNLIRDVERPTDDSGKRNLFIDNTVEP